ncbi:Transcriptional repressor IclR [Leucobacter aridicollis]|uniref:IclR family acetate operon transcriptional repressor n=1 Tax=Leucobacter aridicollis TaxID=283878 RepID=A0A852QYF6_9MICO|nr:IclR family transcriptional regulator [Leucobacter aridicollis]MBL3682943.1 IclR family transcriptional regulator [Leucobacter aridicollis]NYD26381.1 IclR family acetate operon transcriptional repressor [Leucobacter aridicollis]RKQ85204.1 IclR family transcriptional regulator [Mycolicibacterium mucogenicum 261Sha1.1M5]
MQGTSQHDDGYLLRPQTASQKTLAVLEAALLNTRFTDIVDAAELPKSTVHRILAMLIGSGFISGDAEHGYRAGKRFTFLAGRTLSELDIVALAEPIVADLVASTQCTVHIGEAASEEVSYLFGAESQRPYRVHSRAGRSAWLHTTGLGKAVLAHRTEEEVHSYAERTGLPAQTEATLTEVDALLHELEQVAERGYALDLEEHEVGTVCVSAPIFNHRGEPAYSLSISSLVVTHPDDSIGRFGPSAVAAAADISELLGARR